MKVVVASDSFKGSLSSKEIGEIVTRAASKLDAGISVAPVEIADGGEGTVDAFYSAAGEKMVTVQLQNPFGEPDSAQYCVLKDGTAVLEVASVVGYEKYRSRNQPMQASSYGVGQLIAQALQNGAKKLIVGLGGSCTTDGGIGMAAALGFEFLDKYGHILPPVPQSMGQVQTIQTKQVLPQFWTAELIFACDVTNPAHGAQGAAYVFAPQKGATPQQVEQLDGWLQHFCEVIHQVTGVNLQSVAGTGAAGGMAIIPVAYRNAVITQGLDMLLDALDFERLIQDAALVITGEGRLDSQSLAGKVPLSVAKRCKPYNKKVVALVGEACTGLQTVYESGITAVFSICRGAADLKTSIKNSRQNYEAAVLDLLRLVQSFSSAAQKDIISPDKKI